MKVVTKTDEYAIYQRRDGRYAVKDASKQWVNGADKVAILVQHELIEAVLPKPADPEPEADAPEEAAAEADAPQEATAEAESEAADDEGADAPADEADATEADEDAEEK